MVVVWVLADHLPSRSMIDLREWRGVVKRKEGGEVSLNFLLDTI